MKFSEIKAIAAQKAAEAAEAAWKNRPPPPEHNIDLTLDAAVGLLREAFSALDTFEYEYGWSTEHDTTVERIKALIAKYEAMSAPSDTVGASSDEET